MKKLDIRRDIIGKPQTRSILLTREIEVDEETRTVKQISFASDAPIEHWFGKMILDMKPESIRTERISASAPLLLCHNSYNSDEQVGVVEPESLKVTNGMARADIRFSSATRSEEIFQDVKDGIRRNISVGFFVHAMILESEKDGESIYRATDWEPYEISIVPIPADFSVGVGRSLNTNKPQGKEMKPNKFNRADEEMTDEEREAEEEAKRAEEEVKAEEERAEEEKAKEETSARSANPDVKRANDLIAYGTMFGQRDFAKKFALENPAATVDQLRTAIVAERAKTPSTPVPPKPVPQIEFARANYRGQLKAFRGKDAQANAYRSGMWVRAALHNDPTAQKFCRENGISYTRTQTGSDNAKGGVLVPVEFENSIIDLRIEYGVFRRNANVVPMASDTKNQPRRTGGLTAYAVGPGDRGTKSTANWDMIELVARKWMVLAKYEEEFSEDAVINSADTLASEAAYAFTKAEDQAGFNGDGTSTYHGIVGITEKLKGLSGTIADIAGLQVASGNAWSEIAEADVLGVIGRLPQFARRIGGVKWFCSHTFWATVLQRIALTKGGVSYAEINGVLSEVFMGYPVEIVEVMPLTEANSQIPLLFGNLAQAAMLGDRRGVTMKMTDSNDVDFESDLTTIKSTERFDINVHDVGNATATVADKLAGGIVGLITAAA